MKKTKTIIITGNHHTPAIELIKQLKNSSNFKWHIYYIAHKNDTKTHIENIIINEQNIQVFNIECGKFDRRIILKTLKGLPLIVKGFSSALKIINRIKPDIIISFGGYVSVPVIIAGFIKKIPSITHEQTLTLSLSTKINSFFTNKVALSFDIKDTSLPKNKTILTGNLIRSDIFKNDTLLFNKININKFPLVYVTGGNQGSNFINKTIFSLLPELTKHYHIIHQTGQLDYKSASKIDIPNYFPIEYIDSKNIGWIFHHASLIISRSGANICQEIHLFNKNSILIPHPYTQQNEQLKNALWLKNLQPKNTIIHDQNHTKPDTLLASIKQIIGQKNVNHINKISQNIKLLSLIENLVLTKNNKTR